MRWRFRSWTKDFRSVALGILINWWVKFTSVNFCKLLNVLRTVLVDLITQLPTGKSTNPMWSSVSHRVKWILQLYSLTNSWHLEYTWSELKAGWNDTGFPLGLENLEKLEGIFQSGISEGILNRLEKSGKLHKILEVGESQTNVIY